MHARMLIFGMQVDDDLLYRGMESQTSTAYSLYLSICLSFHTLYNEIFCHRFLHNLVSWSGIVGIQVDDDLLYSGFKN